MIATTIAISTPFLGRLRTYQVDAWQSGPLVTFRDQLYGPDNPRWQIRHLASDTWITESRDQARAEQAIKVLLKSKIDWTFKPAPDPSAFHADLALEPTLITLGRKHMITPLAVNLAEAAAARARLRLTLEEDLPADVRDTLGIAIDDHVALNVGVPSTWTLFIRCGDHRWELALDRSSWAITPSPLRLDEHRNAPPPLYIARKSLAGHLDDVCYEIRSVSAAGRGT